MKRIIYPIVFIGTLLVGGALAYSIWRASPQTTQQFFDSGKAYYEEKKYAEAIVQFLNVLQKDPKNREARYFLAMSYEGQKDINATAQTLTALLEYYPDDVPANLRLGGIYLAAGPADPKRFREAQETAQKILSKEPQNVEALILSGNALAGIKDYRSSVQVFEQALSLDPDNANVFVGLGTAQARQENYSDAEQAFLKARKADPKNRSVLIALGNYYRSAGKTNEAEAVFKDALSEYPSLREVYIPVAGFYYQVGNFEQVERVLKDAQDKGAQDSEPSLILADLYQQRNRPVDARKLLLDLRTRFPKSTEIGARLAINFMRDQPDQARAEIDQLLKDAPDNPIGNVLLGELQFFSGQTEQAEATLTKAVNSSFAEPHYFLGLIAASKGQMDQAQDHYQKSLAVNGNYVPARLALAEVFVNKRRLDDARVEVGKVLELEPRSALGRLLKATLDATQKNYQDADKEFAALSKEYPNSVPLQQRLGRYYVARGLTKEAEKSFLRALELQPTSYPVARDLTEFYIGQKQANLAIERINSIPDSQKQAFHYELLGMAYSEAARRQEAEASYKKALQIDPDPNTNVYLVGEYIRSGRVDEALQKLDELLKKNPFNASAYAVKGLISENQGKIENAKENYSEALKIDPNLPEPANSLAYFLAEDGRDLETALKWAQTARRVNPENPNYADTLGWVQHKLGRNVLARDQLQFAVSKQPDQPLYQYHLAVVYKETGQPEQAKAALKKALSSGRNFSERTLAEAALKELGGVK